MGIRGRFKSVCRILGRIAGRSVLSRIYFGRFMSRVPDGAIVFFPCGLTTFRCGIAAIISVKNPALPRPVDTAEIGKMLQAVETCARPPLSTVDDDPGGRERIDSLLRTIRGMRTRDSFFRIFSDPSQEADIAEAARRLRRLVEAESAVTAEEMGRWTADAVEAAARRIEDLKDAAWFLDREIGENVRKVRDLISGGKNQTLPAAVDLFKKVNAVLNSIDRLEVRGRDSAGISLLFVLDAPEFEDFREALRAEDLFDAFSARSGRDLLLNGGISVREADARENGKTVSITLTYKVVEEIGSLGDNIAFLRKEIRNDPVLRLLAGFPHRFHTVAAHTRWASVGAITEPNCHPADNRSIGPESGSFGIIHACLNGDIDNYLELKAELEKSGCLIHKEITSDTKIIPMQVEKYIRGGFEVTEAFRRAVNDFEGSHAICLHTDLAPGKLFLAQKGSGQAIFIGLAPDHYMPASEVYGFIEETSDYIKLDGEKEVEGKNGKTQGQIFVVGQDGDGGLEGLQGMYYDGTPIVLTPKDLKHTEITSRDIDRQNFPHYFLKEISESPTSVKKTLQNRWKITPPPYPHYVVSLNEREFPQSLEAAFRERRIRRVFFVGQGTAGVAASACADIFNYYIADPGVSAGALKSSELSGFKLSEHDDAQSMSDALVVAITQSGTTTDTNRTVDMVRTRGAHTLAIVNRRDSHITFKVDGVIYTSSGRDIEMSVASTKAFYSQIVAGAILGLRIAGLTRRRNEEFISGEVRRLIALPDQMERVLALAPAIEASARRLATTKTYWAVVGSGPNKAAADEIRIKLSELCYKTISADYIEDKKHIDLSAEPLILVCAAGARGTVIGDIIKDAAIFKAHKATPVVIAEEGEERFEPYADDVFHVPAASEHLAPILNTLVGHLWGYYAALSINDGSHFLHRFREDVQSILDEHAGRGLDLYEVVLEKTFREQIASFDMAFRNRSAQKRFSVAMGLKTATDLTLLLKYLSGKVPINDFEIDFARKGTAPNMLATLFERLGEAINGMARPIDAIKHQAKTVTVGTSRIREKLEGILFDSLLMHGLHVSQITNSNIIVLRNLQGIVSEVNGSILYRISGLDFLGDPTEETRIEVVRKNGKLARLSSRVETDPRLVGSKRIIVRERNVYIGKGRKDEQSIIIVPIISASPDSPNVIEYLLLLNISFRENVPLPVKIKALGGKYENIKSIVQENSLQWDDRHLERVEIPELFGRSAEKIGEFIVSDLKSAAAASV